MIKIEENACLLEALFGTLADMLKKQVLEILQLRFFSSSTPLLKFEKICLEF